MVGDDAVRILVTGASGQIGYDVCRELNRRDIPFYGVSSKELDITDRIAIQKTFYEVSPDAVIHCAAYTWVDRAEAEPEKCWKVNVEGTQNLAAACRDGGIRMLYISSDYVFSGTGTTPYETFDSVAPQNVYGACKLAGELAVRSLLEKFFIVRTSWVFGVHGNNFVKTMLALARTKGNVNVVCDQIGSPTYSADLAELLCDIVKTERYGIYHATNEGMCSWADFAEGIFRIAGKPMVVNHVLTRDYPTKAKRPLYSVLSKTSLEKNGFRRLPHWEKSLAALINFFDLCG